MKNAKVEGSRSKVLQNKKFEHFTRETARFGNKVCQTGMSAEYELAKGTWQEKRSFIELCIILKMFC